MDTAAPPVVIPVGGDAARTAGRRVAVVGIILVALTAVGPSLHRGAGDLAFNALGVMQGFLTLLAVRLADRSDQRTVLWTILVAAVAMRLSLLFVHPHLSSDMFRYIWDGRVQGAGINPYRFIPNAPELAFLRDAAVWPFINRADYAVTIYPPAAQMLFALVVFVADGMVAMKLAFLAVEAAAVVILLDLLRRIGQPASRIVAYAWHPLAVYEIAGSAHVDAPMMTLALLGIWLAVVNQRLVLAAFAIALATMMKPLAALACGSRCAFPSRGTRTRRPGCGACPGSSSPASSQRPRTTRGTGCSSCPSWRCSGRRHSGQPPSAAISSTTRSGAIRT